MVETPFSPERVIALDAKGRLPLPVAISRSISWIKGDEAIPVWLLLVGHGRLRVLQNADIDEDSRLEEIRRVITTGFSVSSFAGDVEPDVIAARIGRLIPTVLTPPKPAWRLSIPDTLIKSQEDVRPMLVSGYLEVWREQRYALALSEPLQYP